MYEQKPCQRATRAPRLLSASAWERGGHFARCKAGRNLKECNILVPLAPTMLLAGFVVMLGQGWCSRHNSSFLFRGGRNTERLLPHLEVVCAEEDRHLSKMR